MPRRLIGPIAPTHEARHPNDLRLGSLCFGAALIGPDGLKVSRDVNSCAVIGRGTL